LHRDHLDAGAWIETDLKETPGQRTRALDTGDRPRLADNQVGKDAGGGTGSVGCLDFHGDGFRVIGLNGLAILMQIILICRPLSGRHPWSGWRRSPTQVDPRQQQALQQVGGQRHAARATEEVAYRRRPATRIANKEYDLNIKKVATIHQTARSDTETSADPSMAPAVMRAKKSMFTSAMPNKAHARARSDRNYRGRSMCEGYQPESLPSKPIL
jgi:hypothetical protein